MGPCLNGCLIENMWVYLSLFLSCNLKLKLSWLSSIHAHFSNWLELSKFSDKWLKWWNQPCSQFFRDYLWINFQSVLNSLFIYKHRDHDKGKSKYYPYKHTMCIPRWNDVETTVSTSFQRGIHVVWL